MGSVFAGLCVCAPPHETAPDAPSPAVSAQWPHSSVGSPITSLAPPPAPSPPSPRHWGSESTLGSRRTWLALRDIQNPRGHPRLGKGQAGTLSVLDNETSSRGWQQGAQYLCVQMFLDGALACPVPSQPTSSPGWAEPAQGKLLLDGPAYPLCPCGCTAICFARFGKCCDKKISGLSSPHGLPHTQT